MSWIMTEIMRIVIHHEIKKKSWLILIIYLYTFLQKTKTKKYTLLELPKQKECIYKMYKMYNTTTNNN